MYFCISTIWFRVDFLYKIMSICMTVNVFMIAIDLNDLWPSWQRMLNQLLIPLILWLIMFNMLYCFPTQGLFVLAVLFNVFDNKVLSIITSTVWTQLTSMVSGVGCDDCYDTLPRSQHRSKQPQSANRVHGQHRSQRGNRRVFSGPKKLDMWMAPMRT